MVQRKNLTNMEIYNIATLLLENFKDGDMNLPVKVNFYFQKNMNTIVEMAQDIDKNRMAIFEKYGTRDEENNQYTFKPEVADTVNQELNDLFSLEQEVKVNMLKLDWFDGINLTTRQVSAIEYMIEDDEEENEGTDE